MAQTSGPTAWAAIVNKAFSGNKKIKGGRPKVVVYSATPNAVITAPVGTLCWDITNSNAYINTDGATAWIVINA